MDLNLRSDTILIGDLNQDLLTKNGELLQIFQINGINSEKISKKLSNLRVVVRSAISNNVEGDQLAFWIHTIRDRKSVV